MEQKQPDAGQFRSFLDSGAHKYQDRVGYWKQYAPGHPACCMRVHKFVMVHRLVMEQALGRYLTGEEVVHHIDEDKSNNSIENLELFPSHRDHMLYHKLDSSYRDPVLVDWVREMAPRGEISQEDLSAQLGINHQTLRKILRHNHIQWKTPQHRVEVDPRLLERLLSQYSLMSVARRLGIPYQTIHVKWPHLCSHSQSRKRTKPKCDLTDEELDELRDELADTPCR